MLKILLKKDQQLWVTSDYHIQHKNICAGVSSWDDKSGCRDFQSLKEMEDTIVSNFNSVVKPDDIVINLGDVIFGDKQYLPTFLAKLNCKNIYLLRGNHDDYLDKYPEFKNLFLGVYDYLDLTIQREKLSASWCYQTKMLKRHSVRMILCHYPIASWRDMSDGSIHLHGHCHSNLADDKDLRRLDVGVDVDLYGHKKFSPFSLDEIENIMYNVKTGTKKVDHH